MCVPMHIIYKNYNKYSLHKLHGKIFLPATTTNVTTCKPTTKQINPFP